MGRAAGTELWGSAGVWVPVARPRRPGLPGPTSLIMVLPGSGSLQQVGREPGHAGANRYVIQSKAKHPDEWHSLDMHAG